MGLISSPNHFQFVMSTILSGRTKATTGTGNLSPGSSSDEEDLIGQDCFLYIDDLLVFSKKPGIEAHLDALGRVIDRLSKYGLKAKATKANIAMTSVKFLGWIVDKEGRRANPDKIKAIKDIKIPRGKKSKSRLHAFLGLASFYRALIENFAEITAPLYDLLKKKTDMIDKHWTEEHTVSFNRLKEAFMSDPILVHPDYSKQFIVKTDCSKTHAGAILCQVVDGQERVIEYLSTKLNRTQRRWHMTHLEGWAVVSKKSATVLREPPLNQHGRTIR